MKTNSSAIILSTLLCAVLFSCSKDKKSPQDTSAGPYASAEDVFASLRLQPKVVTINAGDDTSFYGNSGTRYIFRGNTLMTATGATVTGMVQLQVCEYLQKGDMLFSKMLPLSNNEPLLSGGEINVSATQDGNALYLKPGTSFHANIPQSAPASTGMQFFGGVPSADTAVTKVNWLPHRDSDKTSTVIVAGDTIFVVSDSLNQCNADMFMTSPDYQNFTVTISVAGPTLPDTNKVYGYTFYDDYKAEWPLGMIGGYSGGVFTEKHVPNIPVHFVIFTVIGGNFYGGISGATPATGSNYIVTLAKIDPVAFKAQLNAL